MEVASFAEIEEEFTARVSRIVWCTVATVDTQGRPRTRILHPIWEGSTGWIATGRHSLKEKHLAANPYLSVSYWDQEHQQVYVDAKAEWQDDQAEKLRIWNLYKDTPAPYGYDPAIIWQAGPDDPE
ncbi:MAG: pyridoxamine 5'-phosphate oxidase family protein [Chloroflexi bacterium]|nr:pyridoxamine 5'-phosphate oxidase family protein [Chloroflexota bacterium]